MAYLPIATADEITGNEEGNFHLEEAVETAVSMALVPALGTAALTSLSQRLAGSAIIRGLTMGLAGANSTIAGTAVGMVTSDDPLLRLSQVPEDALRSFVAGGVLGALGLNNPIAVTDAGSVEHAIWQSLRHEEITDGLAENIVTSLALGGIANEHRAGRRLGAAPPRRGTRVRISRTETARFLRIDSDHCAIVARGGGTRSIALSTSEPSLVPAATIRRIVVTRGAAVGRRDAEVMCPCACIDDDVVDCMRTHETRHQPRRGHDGTQRRARSEHERHREPRHLVVGEPRRPRFLGHADLENSGVRGALTCPP